jgi:hypothetical protein
MLLSALLVLWGAASAFAEEEPSRDGLPPGVPVPSWAVGKQIHFAAAQATSSLAEPGVSPLVAEGPLKYFKGPVGDEPALFLIFWGKNWTTEPGKELKKELLKLYEGLGGSAYQKILTQYDSSGGRVSSRPSIEYIEEDNGITAPTGVNSTKIIKKAEELLELTGSKKNIDDQYVVLPAPGSAYETGFDKNFCGYHTQLGQYGSVDFIPYAGDPPFSESHIFEGKEYEPCTDYGPYGEPKYSAYHATSGVVSHEYAESVTDPELCSGKAWGTEESCETSDEIADVCRSLGIQQIANGAWVNELYDNTEGTCEVGDESPVLQEIGPYTDPEVETATYITPSSAQLEGGIEPCGLEAHYFFEYGTTEAYGSKTTESTIPSGKWGPLQEPFEVSGLKPDTLYYWRVVVKTSAGTIDGKAHTFVTLYYPVVQTKPATNVTATRATLNGTVNPESAETKYYFEYGTTKTYGSKTAEASAGSGTAGVEESAAIAGLAPSTTYHFRVVASNADGTTDGADEVLTTSASSKPYVETKAATGAGETGATLNGVVNPESAETKYYFEYGTTESYGERTAEASAGSGFGNLEESKAITGLAASTTYYFRIVATNSHGTTDGADQVFSTTGKPSVETKAATGLTSTGATLRGAVNPRAAETKYYFEYGLTTSYGSKTAEASAGSGTTGVEETKAITGLTASTTYHFRIVATNSHGTADGADRTFTTTGPDWYVKEEGAFKAVSSSLKVEVEGTFELVDTKEGLVGEDKTPLGISCKEALGEGTIEAGGAGEIAFRVTYAGSCKGVKGELGTYCEKLEKDEDISSPWGTELYKEGSEDRAKIVNGGDGTPTFSFTCKTLVGSVTDTCGVNTSTHISNNASTGAVEVEFGTKSNKTDCSQGGKEAGEWRSGALKIKATSKAVEAIKVE